MELLSQLLVPSYRLLVPFGGNCLDENRLGQTKFHLPSSNFRGIMELFNPLLVEIFLFIVKNVYVFVGLLFVIVGAICRVGVL